MDGTVRAITCPQCGAGLTPPSRFARDVVCSFCRSTVQIDLSVVSVARFREAFARWNEPETHGYDRWVSFGGLRFAALRRVARGTRSDVFFADRARPPSERVVIKFCRDSRDAPDFEAEWRALGRLASIEDEAAGHFTSLLPSPVVHGVAEGAGYDGRMALAYRDASGFVHALDAVGRGHPTGVDPRIGVWLWRRTLETLVFLHRNGLTHGDLTPAHLIAHGREHAVRLVGFSRLGAGAPAADIQASAGAVASVLPDAVPEPFGSLLLRTARGENQVADAWSLREEVGRAARRAFGAPSYHPLRLPRGPNEGREV